MAAAGASCGHVGALSCSKRSTDLAVRTWHGATSAQPRPTMGSPICTLPRAWRVRQLSLAIGCCCQSDRNVGTVVNPVIISSLPRLEFGLYHPSWKRNQYLHPSKRLCFQTQTPRGLWNEHCNPTAFSHVWAAVTLQFVWPDLTCFGVLILISLLAAAPMRTQSMPPEAGCGMKCPLWFGLISWPCGPPKGADLPNGLRGADALPPAVSTYRTPLKCSGSEPIDTEVAPYADRRSLD
jgi:hypothetical protein